MKLLQRKRSAKPKEVFEPTAFMLEADRFCKRELPEHLLSNTLVGLLADALQVFDEGAKRDRSFWAFTNALGESSFSLLGAICALQGMPILDIDRGEHELACREVLLDLGFTVYDILCLQEINSHSLNLVVLQERIALFCHTGERMPFRDHLTEPNTPEEINGR